MKKSNLLSLFSLAVLASCAGPESYNQKMSRYTPKTLTKNPVPEIKTDGFNFKFKKVQGRMPASSETVLSTKNGQDPTMDLNYTNKKLYFLTMLGQYESMKKYSSHFDAPVISICPNFHSSMLQHNERRPAGLTGSARTLNNKKFTYDQSRLNDKAYITLRPELALPLSQESTTPKVVDVMRNDKNITESKMNELVHRAIDIHLSKTYGEITELCEYGVSDNYYIYENLITHIKNSDFKAVESNMNTLLKTTVFSNMALSTSLERVQAVPMRSIASEKENTSVYANELMTRLDVEWAKEYFDHLKLTK